MVAVVEKVMVHAVEVASVDQKTRQSKVHQDINTDMVMAMVRQRPSQRRLQKKIAAKMERAAPTIAVL
jgi:hypothetical protein